MLLFLISLVSASIASHHFNTTKEILQHRIDAAIHFMCHNQYESNGQFLYEAILHKRHHKIDIDAKDNNMPRQSGGLYAIAMYYKLNHHKHNNTKKRFSITKCIHNSMHYLQSVSSIVDLQSTPPTHYHSLTSDTMHTKPQLINGSTGATALAILGIIEICIVPNNDICNEYLNQFILWIKGLITMRYHKLNYDNNTLNEGALSKKVSQDTESSAYYDSESYLAFSRLIQYKERLSLVIAQDDPLWVSVKDIIDGLDQYYIKYNTENDAHWLIQSWFSRWIALNADNDNNFMNHYIVSILMKQKLESEMDITRDIARCSLMEAVVDVLHSVEMSINTSKYNNNSLDVFKDILWDLLSKRYGYMMQNQLFKGSTDFYMKWKYNGGFIGDSSDQSDKLRIDSTQHCVVALMKIKALVFMNDSHRHTVHSYMDSDMISIEKEGIDHDGIESNTATSYDMMVSVICMIVIIMLVNVIFFYWCCYYPKEQKQRNDLLWMGQTMESGPSDIAGHDSEVVM